MRQSPHARIIFLEQRIQMLLDQLTLPDLSESERLQLIHEVEAASEALTLRRRPLMDSEGTAM
jgi:hypothetical protein